MFLCCMYTHQTDEVIDNWWQWRIVRELWLSVSSWLVGWQSPQHRLRRSRHGRLRATTEGFRSWSHHGNRTRRTSGGVATWRDKQYFTQVINEHSNTRRVTITEQLTHSYSERPIRGDGYKTGDERAITLPLTCWKIFWKSYELVGYIFDSMIRSTVFCYLSGSTAL